MAYMPSEKIKPDKWIKEAELSNVLEKLRTNLLSTSLYLMV